MQSFEKQTVHRNRSNIEELRKIIDAIDEKILELMNRRFEIALAIGQIKEKNGEPIIDTVRENKIIDRLVWKNRGPIDTNTLQEIFRMIIAESRKIQKLSELNRIR